MQLSRARRLLLALATVATAMMGALGTAVATRVPASADEAWSGDYNHGGGRYGTPNESGTAWFSYCEGGPEGGGCAAFSNAFDFHGSVDAATWEHDYRPAQDHGCPNQMAGPACAFFYADITRWYGDLTVHNGEDFNYPYSTNLSGPGNHAWEWWHHPNSRTDKQHYKDYGDVGVQTDTAACCKSGSDWQRSGYSDGDGEWNDPGIAAAPVVGSSEASGVNKLYALYLTTNYKN